MPSDRHIEKTELPTVALVGRVNVGKSTLFNRLIEERAALVSRMPGTTRTPNVGIVLWRGKEFRLVDTGGLTFTDDVPLEADILKQSERAMKEADAVIFVTNAQEGVLPQEKELAKRLRRIKVKPVLFVANKADTPKLERDLSMPEWSRLGLGFPIPISAGNGRNIGDFLDLIYTTLVEAGTPPVDTKEVPEPVRISIIGKPNVGKSSLFNTIIGEERVIVSDLPHTTREPHDTAVLYEHKKDDDTNEAPEPYHFVFVDTAGIRRKAKVSGQLEQAGIKKSLEAVESSDIVLFVVDGSQPISSQDKQLGGLLERHNKSVIILLNKWDLAEDNSDAARKQAKEFIEAEFPHLSFAPIIFVSGKTGYRVHQIFPTLVKVWHGRQTHIANRGLEKFLAVATKEHRPSRGKGTRHPELMGMRQVHDNPPIFELFVKARTSVHRSYINFLERKLREQFDFFGTPIVIRLTKMKR